MVPRAGTTFKGVPVHWSRKAPTSWKAEEVIVITASMIDGVTRVKERPME